MAKNGTYIPPKFQNPDKPRWTKEKTLQPCATDDQDRKVGYGSYYKRAYADYTCEEMLAKQGRSVRVRTKDLIPLDRVKRELAGDDSDLESDWLDRTGHQKGHVKSMGNMAANRTILNNNLPAAYATDKSKRTKLQKESFEWQKPGYAQAASVKEAVMANNKQK